MLVWCHEEECHDERGILEGTGGILRRDLQMGSGGKSVDLPRPFVDNFFPFSLQDKNATLYGEGFIPFAIEPNSSLICSTEVHPARLLAKQLILGS